jgi:translation initiation factor 3 subunit A
MSPSAALFYFQTRANKLDSAPKVPHPLPCRILNTDIFSIELIAVGQNLAALQSLHEIITSKRSKSASLQSLEPIMLRFVELCVNLRKGKMAKEGLYQFKNIAQNTNVSSIEVSSHTLLLYPSPAH